MRIFYKICFLILLFGCQNIQPPLGFLYKEISTAEFNLASWQKISDINADYHIYIEGDGYAFNAHGEPSRNPTPHGDLMRKICFSDMSPNVIYLARPCQFVKDEKCRQGQYDKKYISHDLVTHT